MDLVLHRGERLGSIFSGGAPSNGGTIFRTRPKKRLCGSGAWRTGSNSAGPKAILLPFTGGLDKSAGLPKNPFNSLLSRALIRLGKAGLWSMTRIAEPKV